MHILRQIWAATKALLVFTLVLGVAYPLAMTAVAQVTPRQAHGSLIETDGRTTGSALLGQAATSPRWFQARPSVVDHAGGSSGGSNYGQSAPAQLELIATRRAALVAANPAATTPPPADAVTASASGLDPHISPAYARWQVPRVAQHNNLTAAQVQQLIDQHTERPLLPFLGEPSVNVVRLNTALATQGSGR